MFRFGAMESLWALGVIPVLLLGFVYAARSRKRALAQFAETPLVEKLTESVSLKARRWKTVLTLVAVTFALVALGRPQFGTRVETVRAVGQDIMIAVDLSRSMMAEDVRPNRLERARLAILRLMSQLDGDRIGLVAFAGDAFVQSPLTIDYSAASLFLGAMEPDLVPVPGTDLGVALRVSLDALSEAREARVLVVVTDGEDHEGTFDAEIRRAQESGVKIHMVGIGSPEGVPIPEYDGEGNRQGFMRDEEGNVVTTRLDEATLQRIARETGGRYVQAAAGGTGFDDLIDEIASADGEALDDQEITQFEEQYQIFLGVALFLLLLEIVVPDRRRTREAWLGRFA